MEHKNISMMDIARMSGVSIATVSRVLNKTGRYSAKTEQRVMEVVEQTKYSINPNAQGLRTNRTKTIGVVIPDITNEYFSHIVRAIEAAIMPYEYSVFVCDSNENAVYEDHHLASLAAKGVDGIIYISTRKTAQDIAGDFSIPVVYIDRSPGVDNNCVTSDNRQGGYLATKELIDKGCRQIVLVRDKNFFSTVNDRVKGFLRAHRKAGLQVDDRRILSCNVDYEQARAAITGLIARQVPFDGVFCTTDIMALGVLRGLLENGLRVPQDVKLCGFDGITHTKISHPSITTVVQDTKVLGEQAVKLLMELIENPQAKNKEYQIPVTLEERESTATQ